MKSFIAIVLWYNVILGIMAMSLLLRPKRASKVMALNYNKMDTKEKQIKSESKESKSSTELEAFIFGNSDSKIRIRNSEAEEIVKKERRCTEQIFTRTIEEKILLHKDF